MTGPAVPADLAALTAAMLDAARRAGADAADAMAVAGASVGIDIRGRALEHAERAEATEIGLRVLVGGRQACVSASDTSADTLRAMAERAVAMAREAPADDTLGLADPGQVSARRDAAGLDLAEDGPEPEPMLLADRAAKAEAAALDTPGITQVESASASYSRRWLWLAATNGFAGGYVRTSHAVTAVAITGTGTAMERDFAGEARAHAADLPDPAGIGALAAQRALARAAARKPPTGAFPILFDRRVAASLISHLLAAANGGAVARGASWLRDALGRPVLSAGLRLDEDPHRPRFPASRPFDAEGLATAPRSIVDADGVLTGWTLDLGTARKLGMASTASAARGLTSGPTPSNANVVLSGGAGTADDLIAAMGTGLIVTAMLGASINPTTGDYSRGAAGLWVEGGRIVHPVNECTIAGSLPAMLRALQAADDAEPWRSLTVPSLLVTAGMTVAGA